jgi:hypothetical protein
MLITNQILWFLELGFRIRIGSGFNRVSGSGSRRAKMTLKRRRKSKIILFSSVGWPLLRAEDFFSNFMDA